MSRNAFDAFISRYDDNSLNPVKCRIPLGISGKDLINYLTQTYNLKISDQSLLIAKYKSKHNENIDLYSFAETKKDLAKISTYNSVSIIIFPPKIFLHVHGPDGHEASKEYDCKTPSSEFVNDLCSSSFKLQDPLAYALYFRDNENNFIPMNPNRTITEYNPFLQDIYIRRRFWFKFILKTNKEYDVFFNFCQAKELVYDPNFDYKKFNFVDLIGINLALTYGTYDQAKDILKNKKKKELKTIYPKYVYKSHNKIKKCMKAIKKFEGTRAIELQQKFLSLCMENPLFGLKTYPIISNIPYDPSAERKNYLLAANDNHVMILDPMTHNIVYQIEVFRIKKWRACSIDEIEITFFDEKKENEGRGSTVWRFTTRYLPAFMEYFGCLINILGHYIITNKNDEEAKTKRRPRSYSSAHRTKSVDFDNDAGGILRDLELIKNDISSEVPFSDDVLILPIINAPQQQNPIEIDVTKINVPICQPNDYLPLVNGCDNNNGYSLPKTIINDESQNEMFITDVPNLLNDFINGNCSFSDAVNFLQSSITTKSLRQYTISSILQTPAYSDQENICVLAKALGYFIYTQKFSPLDAFNSLNYIRLILLRYTKEQINNEGSINPSIIAHHINDSLGDFYDMYLDMIKSPGLPILALLFSFDQSKKHLFYLIESVIYLLLLSSLCICESLTRTGIASDLLQPLLEAVPEIPSTDYGLLPTISNTLCPIIDSLKANENAANILFGIDHASQVEIKSIIHFSNELKNVVNSFSLPLYTLIISFSTQLHHYFFDVPPPNSLIDAQKLYDISRAVAVGLWNVENGPYRSYSHELSYYASLFYNECIESINEKTNGFSGSSFNKLCEKIKIIENVLPKLQTIESLLSNNDPAERIILNLLNSTENISSTISLLCVNLMLPQQRMRALKESKLTIQGELRNLRLQIDTINSAYRVYSIIVISFNRQNKNFPALIQKLGEDLLHFASEDHTQTSQAQLIAISTNLINRLESYSQIEPEKPFELTITKPLLNVIKKAPINRLEPVNEICFVFHKENLAPILEILKKLSFTLRRFDFY